MLAECVTNRVFYGSSELDYEMPTPSEVLDEFAGRPGVGDLILADLQQDFIRQISTLNPGYKENIDDMELLWSDDPALNYEVWVTYSVSGTRSQSFPRTGTTSRYYPKL